VFTLTSASAVGPSTTFSASKNQESSQVPEAKSYSQNLVLKKPARKNIPMVTAKYKHPSMHGYKKSVYRGKFYRANQEHYRKCVMQRESNHTYGARNHPSVSSAAGAYQFLDKSWRPGLAHMIFPELKKDYGKQLAVAIRKELIKTPIEKWSREMQDRGFFTVLNYNGNWSGKKHWNMTVPGTGC
jgi:muramidase (phage lysozyme)